MTPFGGEAGCRREPPPPAASAGPSGDALDRATKLVTENGVSAGRVKLINEVAKLIDRADTAGEPTAADSNGRVDLLASHLYQAFGGLPKGMFQFGGLSRQLQDYWRGCARVIIRDFGGPTAGELDSLRRVQELEHELENERRRVADLEEAQAIRAKALREARIDLGRAREELVTQHAQLLENVSVMELTAEVERRLLDGAAARETLEANR